MSAPLTVHFVRHGKVFNPNEILYGRLPNFYLSDEGREQARATGQYFAQADITAFYASPMERAQETANIILQAHHIPHTLHTDERIHESFTPHQGKPVAEVNLVTMYDGNLPPHERASDMRHRILNFVAEMRQKHANREIVAVTHGDVLVIMFMFAHGSDPEDIGRGRLMPMGLSEQYPATAGILSFTYHTSDADELPTWSYVRPY
jgi:broad specificity phosphatase PhoE